MLVFFIIYAIKHERIPGGIAITEKSALDSIKADKSLIWNFRFIKMSSPRLNNVIVVGAILIYIAGILLGIDGNFASIDIEAILRCRVSTFNHILLL